jgi:hypothetical protein
MANFSTAEVLAVFSAIVLIANAIEKVAKAWRIAKAPNAKQDERLDKVEKRLDDHDACLAADKKRLDSIDKGDRAIQKALLALLDHGIDGNNTEQMKRAKEELQNHLIER